MQIATNLGIRIVQYINLFHQGGKEFILLLRIAISIDRNISIARRGISIATLRRILSAQLGIVVRGIQQTGITKSKATTKEKSQLISLLIGICIVYPRLMFGLLPLPSNTSVEF